MRTRGADDGQRAEEQNLDLERIQDSTGFPIPFPDERNRSKLFRKIVHVGILDLVCSVFSPC
jgi:hypothetical protein